MAHPTELTDAGDEFFESPSGLRIYHRGPPLSQGPLPSLFYFALSGYESLFMDPFRQPADLLADTQVRVFSFTLPYHGEGLDPHKAVGHWMHELLQGNDIIRPFLQQLVACIQFLIDKKLAAPDQMAAAGISRGAFIAAHLASMHAGIRWLLGFAPMTSFILDGKHQELQENALINSLGVMYLSEQLAGKTIRFYVGNRDVRIGTEQCFAFMQDLVEKTYQKGIRSPPVDLIISPSVGYKGHGTTPPIFQDGIKWLKSCMLK
jgi:esterase FrsA